MAHAGQDVEDATVQQYIDIIAREYFVAMQDLDVQVKPKVAQKPKPTRTRGGKILMLLAALENGDMWVRDVAIHGSVIEEDTPRRVPVGGLVEVDAGLFTVKLRISVNQSLKTVMPINIESIVAEGTQYTAKGDLTWLKVYLPPIELDGFSSALQHTLTKGFPGWRATRMDHEGRQWRWNEAGQPELWKDARGREL